MKVLALFDKSGKIHALFHPSTEADALLSFHPNPAGARKCSTFPPSFTI